MTLITDLVKLYFFWCYFLDTLLRINHDVKLSVISYQLSGTDYCTLTTDNSDRFMFNFRTISAMSTRYKEFVIIFNEVCIQNKMLFLPACKQCKNKGKDEPESAEDKGSRKGRNIGDTKCVASPCEKTKGYE